MRITPRESSIKPNTTEVPYTHERLLHKLENKIIALETQLQNAPKEAPPSQVTIYTPMPVIDDEALKDLTLRVTVLEQKKLEEPTTALVQDDTMIQEMTSKIEDLQKQLHSLPKDDHSLEIQKVKKALSETLIFMMQFRANIENRFNSIPKPKLVRPLDYALIGICLLNLIRWCLV